MRYLLCAALAAIITVSTIVPVQAAEPIVWKVAVLVFDRTVASCNGTPVNGTLDRAAAQRMLDDFTARIAEWSDGEAIVTLTLIERPYLYFLSPDGNGGCWPAPGDTYDEDLGETYPSGYDSVLVLWDADGPDERHVSNSAGLAYTDFRPGGMTYGTAVVPDGAQAWWIDNPYPGKVLVHEWGNGALAWYRQFNPGRVPSWYDHATYGYAPGDPQWYADVLGGDIVQDGKRIGLTPARWHNGTPS